MDHDVQKIPSEGQPDFGTLGGLLLAARQKFLGFWGTLPPFWWDIIDMDIEMYLWSEVYLKKKNSVCVFLNSRWSLW